MCIQFLSHALLKIIDVTFKIAILLIRFNFMFLYIIILLKVIFGIFSVISLISQIAT